MYEEIRQATASALTELLTHGTYRPGDLVVIGCSSSEIVGQQIGKASVPEAARAVVEGALPVLQDRGLFLAAQCCEHLNRALVLEREAALRYGYEEVCVIPQPKAGGSFATAAYASFRDPVAVEHIRAVAGLDIGDTFIGMHLRDVAVPVRLSVRQIGSAHLTAAYTRPKLIGGERAVYHL
jgi:uncharacterized protein (TIGR01440 family)